MQSLWFLICIWCITCNKYKNIWTSTQTDFKCMESMTYYGIVWLTMKCMTYYGIVWYTKKSNALVNNYL